MSIVHLPVSNYSFPLSPQLRAEHAALLAGFAPVGAIALHVLDMVPLYISFFILVLPSIAILIWTGIRSRETGRRILKGWYEGIAAVALYDLVRIPFIFAGWSDFIPHIGDWLLDRPDTSPFLGYLWRYIGNGGGMGISFTMLMVLFPTRKNYILPGILFGLFVFIALTGTILLTPKNGSIMFDITLLTFCGSLTGHLVYGAALGYFLSEKYRHPLCRPPIP